MVFLARFKSVLIRTGGWAGHFVLSCGLTLQTLVSTIMMLNKLREMSSRGPSGHPDGASWGRRGARASHGEVFTVQALLSEVHKFRNIIIVLRSNPFIG